MAFLGKKLLSHNGEVLSTSLILTNPLLLYFSASWCPPCRHFTPKLIDFYNSHNKTNKPLEVVFTSFDENESEFLKYFSKMPWLSIPFSEKATIEGLASKYSVASIPTLVLVNKNGDALSSDCRNQVDGHPSEAYEKFAQLLKESSSK